MGDLYLASEKRYEKMTYNRVGKSGLKFPAVSLGFWHNFGNKDNYDNMKAMCRKAFDLGITQFDLANNYGPVYGSAEENAGRILQEDFRPYRDELVITSKAGYDMWPGPYGDWGSKKYLTASIDQSLSRLQLEYVDIFYHHRMDPETPLEETMEALASIVRSGKALYAGISNYNQEYTEKAAAIMKELEAYGDLRNRPMIVVANKMDLPGAEENLARLRGKLDGTGIQIFPVSAATNPNFRELLYATVRMLDQCPPAEPFSEEELAELSDFESEPFTVEVEDGAYFVSGREMDRLIASVNFDSEDSLNFFHRSLRRMGVIDALREKGAQEGDTVVIGEMEFDFVE